MAEMKTTCTIATFKNEPVKLSLSDDNGYVAMKQGQSIIFITEDEFKAFLQLAGHWYKNCERVA